MDGTFKLICRHKKRTRPLSAEVVGGCARKVERWNAVIKAAKIKTQ
jgi:hypothetical protein